MNTQLLQQLCEVHAPSGEEFRMKEFLLSYIQKEKKNWKHPVEIIDREEFRDGFLLKFGKPRTAVFAHMDSIGFTARYENQLVSIGGPDVQTGFALRGSDENGEISCQLIVDEDGRLFHSATRPIERGTSLIFECSFREDDETVQSCSLDNRLGILNALELCQNLEHGVIAFSCYEEHGGGSAIVLGRYIYEELGVSQALISDVTWATDGVFLGKGTVVSLRDRGIPRYPFVRKIREIANKSDIAVQLEAEGTGGSDGAELQRSPYPFDWCFIGPPSSYAHSPDELIYKSDYASNQQLYQLLMKNL
ncbi:MAG: aminopeptidase [Cytophagales bacterium]|nr:aminopeptidase [Cytophagales bacterium]